MISYIPEGEVANLVESRAKETWHI